MWPNEFEGYMTCILCSEKLTSFKVSTITRHIDNRSVNYNPAKRQRVLVKPQEMLKKATTANHLRVIAPYKLTFTVVKHKMLM